MGALADIRAALEGAKRGKTLAGLLGSTPRFKVKVGIAAELSIQCEHHDNQLPHMIDGAAVERTDEFEGWEVVEL